MLLAQARPLTLDDAVKLAMERNPDLRKQVLLALSAEQDRVIAGSAIVRQLGFNASAAEQGVNGVQYFQGVPLPGLGTSYGETYSSSLKLTQLVFDGGRWWNTLSASDLGLQASEAQVDEQRLQITYLVEQRFYELVRAPPQLLVPAAAARPSRDQAHFTQRPFEGGRSPQADGDA